MASNHLANVDCPKCIEKASVPRPEMASEGQRWWIVVADDGTALAVFNEADAADRFGFIHKRRIEVIPAARAEALERDLSATIQAAAMREVTLRDNANRLDTEQRLRWAATQQRDEALERVRELEEQVEAMKIRDELLTTSDEAAADMRERIAVFAAGYSGFDLPEDIRALPLRPSPTAKEEMP